MPEQVACPSCSATLRVPETLLGKNVKCPKCQTTFLAETQAPAEPEEAEERIANEPAPGRSSSRRREAIAEDYEDEAPPDEGDEDRPRRRRRGYGTAAAESAVSGPAISLMIVAGIDIIIALLRFVAPVLGFSMMALGGQKGRGAADADFMASTGVNIIFGVLTLIMGILILVGAMKMKQLKSYGFAMTACILAMIPCVNCCILGLPFGIWGIVMLNKPEVKEAFS